MHSKFQVFEKVTLAKLPNILTEEELLERMLTRNKSSAHQNWNSLSDLYNYMHGELNKGRIKRGVLIKRCIELTKASALYDVLM